MHTVTCTTVWGAALGRICCWGIWYKISALVWEAILHVHCPVNSAKLPTMGYNAAHTSNHSEYNNTSINTLQHHYALPGSDCVSQVHVQQYGNLVCAIWVPIRPEARKKGKGTNTPSARYWHNIWAHADHIAHSVWRHINQSSQYFEYSGLINTTCLIPNQNAKQLVANSKRIRTWQECPQTETAAKNVSSIYLFFAIVWANTILKLWSC